MLVKDFRGSKERIIKLIDQKPSYLKGSLLPIVKYLLKKRKKILELSYRHATPFYLFDQDELTKSVMCFLNAFKTTLPQCKVFFAMKPNHHPYVIETVLKHGLGLDVSSGRELKIAINHKAQNILFSGPGKTLSELEFAVKNNATTIVNIDSFRELEKLAYITRKRKKRINAGVRIFTNHHGSWSKFGIPLAELKKIWHKAKKYSGVNLQGIQFHISWNKDATLYEKNIKEISDYLRKKCDAAMLRSIKFIDFGGGFLPSWSEGYYPWNLPQGKLIQLADEYFGKKTQFINRYFISEAIGIEEFAQKISAAIKKYLEPLIRCEYFTEPGRIICHKAMHIVLKIVDIKNSNLAITDGGTNMVGWERFEHEYYPLINLTHPSTRREIPFRLYGSLCTPHDIWGYYCYAKKVEEGDILLVPYQGAYAFSLARNFIKPIPKVYILRS
ncbi:alanine racemase [Candidatus Microgenomates bacterium]|nr:alanine racemase [Candidatus Microgenomates bacterium]